MSGILLPQLHLWRLYGSDQLTSLTTRSSSHGDPGNMLILHASR